MNVIYLRKVSQIIGSEGTLFSVKVWWKYLFTDGQRRENNVLRKSNYDTATDPVYSLLYYDRLTKRWTHKSHLLSLASKKVAKN